MLRLFLVSAFIIIGCNAVKRKTLSWEDEKKKFKYHNLKEFISNEQLRTDLKTLKKPNNKQIDSLFPLKRTYLYSWQERDSTKHEFTIAKDEGELGINIYYLIFDKKSGSLISVVDIAGAGNEGGYIFETRSKFINNDSLLQIHSITQWTDAGTKMEKTLGDSTFVYLTIDKAGKISESKWKEVKEINYSTK